MAITITTDLSVITACDSITDAGTFIRLNGTSSANPAADADTKVQNSNCVANKMGTTAGATDAGCHFNSTATFDLTGNHLYHWRFIVTASNMAAKSSRGIALGLTNTSTTSTSAWSSTNYKMWYLDGSDTLPISTGWTCYVLDPSGAADASAGTLTLSSVKNIGFICRQSSGVTTTLSNQFIDIIRMGTGLVATASSAGDTISLNTIYATDSSSTNAWGIITQVSGIFYGAGKITVGSASQSNTCLFKDTSAVFLWKEFPVSLSLYQIILASNGSTNITVFQLGEIDGSGRTSNGCVFRGQGSALWTLTSDTNSRFKFYSSAFSRILSAALSSLSEIKDCSFVSCGTITTNGCTITDSLFSSNSSTQLRINSASQMDAVTGCVFTSAGTKHAIEITASGVYDLNNLTFNNFAASSGYSGNEAIYINGTSSPYETYSSSNHNADYLLGVVTYNKIGQSFTGNGGVLSGVSIMLAKNGTLTASLAVEIYAHTGVFGTSSLPTGSALIVSDPVLFNDLSGTSALVSFSFPSELTLTNSVNYVAVLRLSAMGDVSNYVKVGTDNSAPAHAGNASLGDSLDIGWTALVTDDLIFSIYTDYWATLNVIDGSVPSVRTSAGFSAKIIAGSVTTEVLAITAAGTVVQNANILVKADAGGPFPFDVTVTITNSGTVATVAHTSHALSTGDKIVIKGANIVANNGVFTINKINNNSYSYTMGSSPGSSPTGTIKATFVIISGLTDINGLISATRVIPSDQPVTGLARKSSSAPFYKTSSILGVISSTTGASLSAIMTLDQ